MGAGDDNVWVQSSANAIYGEAGDDSFSVLSGADNLLDGGDGNDGFGLDVGSGNNTVIGGLGVDFVYIQSLGQDVALVLSGGAGVATWATGSAAMTGIESITTSYGNDFVAGDAANNAIVTDMAMTQFSAEAETILSTETMASPVTEPNTTNSTARAETTSSMAAPVRFLPEGRATTGWSDGPISSGHPISTPRRG